MKSLVYILMPDATHFRRFLNEIGVESTHSSAPGGGVLVFQLNIPESEKEILLDLWREQIEK